MHWASSLDEKRGRAVNPTTNEQWFDLLEDEDIYGQDESGFQSIQSSKQRVIGARLTKIQHQQSDGGRE
ncbi:hypothetical protein EV361DRAFT_832454, partial [Lentinula raphanica]